MYKFNASAVYAARDDVLYFECNCSLKKKIAFSLNEMTKELHKWTLLCDFFYYLSYVTVIVPDYLHYFKLSDSYKMLSWPVKKKVLTLTFYSIGMFCRTHKFLTGRAVSSTRWWLARDPFIHVDECSPQSKIFIFSWTTVYGSQSDCEQNAYIW